MKIKTCYLCSANESLKPYANPHDHTLVQCSHCGLVSTEQIPLMAVKELYEDESYYSSKGGSGFDIDGYLANGLDDGLAHHYDKERFQPLFREVRKKLADQKIHYLDIGCSAGLLLATARDYGWDVKGIEASPLASKTAREKLNLDVVCGEINSVEVGEKKFEAISLFHVLEHLPDPRVALRIIRKALTDNGILALEVPNIRSLPAVLRKKDWHGYVLPYHLWHFSFQTLKDLLDQEGFKTLYQMTPYVPCSGAHIFNVHGFATKYVRKLLKKKPSESLNLNSEVAPSFLVGPPKARKWVERSVRNLYWPVDKLMAKTGIGEVLYILAEKKLS